MTDPNTKYLSKKYKAHIFLQESTQKSDFCKENSYPFDFVLDRGLYS